MSSWKRGTGTKADNLYHLFHDVAAAHHQTMLSFNISPFWFAVGTNLPGRFFDLEGQQFSIIAPSLGNLLDKKYLIEICKKYFDAEILVENKW